MSSILLDKEKFAEVYRQYYPILLVYGRNITTDDILIEDTIQELFLSLWQKKRGIVIQSSLDSYLLVAFRNNLIRKIKQQQTQELPVTEIAIEVIENVVVEKEQRLQQLIQQLPPRQREVLFLRYYKNKSYSEIAEMLGISYQVARNFSYRALQFLRKNMQPIILLYLPTAFF